jgi:hypothetical protein
VQTKHIVRSGPELGVRRNRYLASALEGVEKGTFSSHQQRGGCIVYRLPHGRRNGDILGSHGYTQRSLPRGWEYHLGIQPLTNPTLQAEPDKACGRQHDAGPLGMSIQFGQASVHVTAEINQLQIRPMVKQLSPASQAAGRDQGSIRYSRPGKRGAAYQRVPRIIPLADGADHNAWGKTSRQVLERVNCQIDAVLEQGIVDLLRKQCPASQGGQGGFGGQISGGLDFYSLGLVSGGRQERADSFGLPQR